ncbi:MAG TPA: hypothetical protein V6D00_06715 [Pantanalinema sp.]
MRRLAIALLAGGMLVLCAPGARAAYGSAQISPYLVSARLRLALDHLRVAEKSLTAVRGGTDVVSPYYATTRQSLADAADQLTYARMATMDEREIRRMDAILAGLDEVRELMDTSLLKAPDRLRRLEGETMSLDRAVRAPISRRAK